MRRKEHAMVMPVTPNWTNYPRHPEEKVIEVSDPGLFNVFMKRNVKVKATEVGADRRKSYLPEETKFAKAIGKRSFRQKITDLFARIFDRYQGRSLNDESCRKDMVRNMVGLYKECVRASFSYSTTAFIFEAAKALVLANDIRDVSAENVNRTINNLAMELGKEIYRNPSRLGEKFREHVDEQGIDYSTSIVEFKLDEQFFEHVLKDKVRSTQYQDEDSRTYSENEPLLPEGAIRA